MAEVIITETANQGASATGFMDIIIQPLMFLINNWYIFVIAILFAVAIGIVIYMIGAVNESRRERDEAGYWLYKKTIQDCLKNQNPKKYRKRYSLKNLFLLGIPLFWIDDSKRILNKYDEMIGRYRGHSRSQDGTYNLLICTSSILGVFDTNILLKIPERIASKEEVIETNKKTGKQKKTVRENVMKFDLHSENSYDGTIKVNCVGIERTAMFYFMPVVLVKDDDGKEIPLDARKFVEGSIADSTYQVMLTRMLNQSQKQMEKAMQINPNLKYDQMKPQKTAPEQDLDKYGQE